MMKKLIADLSFLTLSLFFCLIIGANPHLAQADSIKEAQKTSQAAQQLYEQNRFPEAIKQLDQGISQCLEKKCRAMLNFSLAYMYQQQAEKVGTDQAESLKIAAEKYSAALEDLPDNQQIFANLVLVYKNLGDWKRAVSLLEQAAATNRPQSDLYLAEAGDIYSQNGDLDRALASYHMASQTNQDNETPIWRILTLYKKLPDNALKDLLRFSLHLKEINHPAPAKYGFEQIINRAFSVEPKLAELAFLSWAEVVSAGSNLSIEIFSGLPTKTWSMDGFQQLYKLTAIPTTEPSQLHWWQSSEEKRHLLAAFMKSLAKQLIIQDNINEAAHLLESSLEIAPEFYRYNSPPLKNRPIIVMDIALELASLYHKYPALDPGQKKFKVLEAELFNEKALGYARNNLPDIQKSHTVLGLIYAERSIWKSSWGAANAIFQLEHAIGTAKEMTKQNPGSYQPLPYLNSLLAKGYSATGEKKKAFSAYLEAAAGYLDYDDLKKAELMLNTSSTVASNLRHDPKKQQELQMILNTRQRIPTMTAENLQNSSTTYFGNNSETKWLLPSDKMALDASFLNRQRFKTLADLGEKAARVGLISEPANLRAAALGTLREEKALANMDDVVRLQKIQKTVEQDKNIRIKNPQKTLQTGNNLEQSGYFKPGEILSVNLPFEQQILQIGISQDLLLATKMQATVSSDKYPNSKAVKINIADSNVTILNKQEVPAELVEKIRTMATPGAVKQLEPPNDKPLNAPILQLKIIP